MEITNISNSEVTIEGHIKTIEDYQKIKQALNAIIVDGQKKITINIPQSLTMTSSVIGYLLKLVFENKIDLSIMVKDEKLLNLLDVLNLVAVFKVKKM
ncbi:hypothetical protein MBAV_006014 [Candidatus Magnetobacterium bavaricum]|uniref:STAS domain-containing protein n=1 Tax=Candidatus Magnetobacterium bavaricum TaxID=29290 RepID=A0A0F3GIP3_9BACT|nr:hypothetical protein MBAV_006014 [Candidatus Magnetobacterium bavaricum]